MLGELARKTFDVAWLSANGVTQGRIDWGKIFEPGRSNWQRGIDLFGLIHGLAPIIKRIYPDTLFDRSKLPFSSLEINFISAGSNQAVYRFGNVPGERLALKVDRKTLCTDVNPLVEARKASKNYQGVRNRFGYIKGLMLPEDFLVTEVDVNYLFGLKAKTGVFLTIQPFLEGGIKDFFRDFNQDELRQRFNQNPIQQDRFATFAERFFQTFFNESLCLGIFGRNNLCVTDNADNRGWELHLLDAHGLFKSGKLLTRSRSNIRSVAGMTVRIAGLLKELGGTDYSERVAEFGLIPTKCW